MPGWPIAASSGGRRSKLGDTLLVCDVGGGTTDLTLVTVAEEGGELVLRRMAVGNHLLVGGDNMDLALAHFVAGRFAEKGTKLDPWQSVALWHSCRNAKESLLAAEGNEGQRQYPISVLGRGSRLIGGTVTTEVDRAGVGQLLVDGFFPHCKLSDRPARRMAAGFRELGLPYENDTAITRHLAAFLQAHGKSADEPVRPTHVLFNGGVFKADVLRQRLLDVLGEWFKSSARKITSRKGQRRKAKGDSPANARRPPRSRSRRRSRRGLLRLVEASRRRADSRRHGPRLLRRHRDGRAGRARRPRPLRALCVVPIGMEEGSEVDVPSGEIGLIVGEPAQFRFFSSPVRKSDRPGDVLSSWSPDELEETDSLGGDAPGRGGRCRRLRARAVSFADHGARRAGIMVREHERQRAVEVGVQREGGVSFAGVGLVGTFI